MQPKPQPTVTPDNQPFWEGCAGHELLLPYCDDCSRPHLPPGPVCPFCLSDALSWRRASGRGRISSWTVVRRSGLPAFEAPYNVVHIELDEGPRLTTTIVGEPRALKIGQQVEVTFEDRAAGPRVPVFLLLDEA